MSFLHDVLQYFRGRKNTQRYLQMINGGLPIFSQIGNDIYASDVVQQAVYCIVSELKKLRPRHVRVTGTDVQPVRSDRQAVLDSPNPLMTTSEFLEKVVWMLLLNCNAFVLKTTVRDRKGNQTLTALWPLQPRTVEFEQDGQGNLYILFRFGDGMEYEVPYESVIHLRHKYSINEYMGGNEWGQPDNQAILNTVSLNDKLLQSVSTGLQGSYSVNGLLKINTMMDRGKSQAALRELEENLNSGRSGILPVDLSADYIKLDRDIKLVDKDTLEFLDSKILRHWGVPLPILTGDFTPQQMAAFYQKTLEPIIVGMSQSFTKSLFSLRENLSYGNEIRFYFEELIFMDINQKLEMVRLLGDSGALYENEKRTIFGMVPLPELVGVRQKSLNYVSTDIAAQYQLGQTKKEEETDAEQESTD